MVWQNFLYQGVRMSKIQMASKIGGQKPQNKRMILISSVFLIRFSISGSWKTST